jgi:hypothetical protein
VAEPQEARTRAEVVRPSGTAWWHGWPVVFDGRTIAIFRWSERENAQDFANGFNAGLAEARSD